MAKLHYYNLSLKILEEVKTKKQKPRILLHACCGPCSAFPLEFLCPYFDVTLYYQNSNIYPESEFQRRKEELIRFLQAFERDYHYHVDCIFPPYDEENYSKRLAPYAYLPEGSERCFHCYRFRMEEGYDYAEQHGFAYFATIMTISTQKNSFVLNQIGEELEKNHPHCRYFYSDFKKKKGADRARELTSFYQLYRQNYCGCRYSYAEKEAKMKQK